MKEVWFHLLLVIIAVLAAFAAIAGLSTESEILARIIGGALGSAAGGLIVSLIVVFVSYLRSRSGLIHSPPGKWYMLFGKFILNKKTYKRVMEQSVNDMQQEYFEALSKKNHKLARWIKIRFVFEFIIILGLNLPILKQLVDISIKLAK